MNPSARLAVFLTSGGALALVVAVAWALWLRGRRKDPAEIERLRRLDLNRRGRICAAHILDMVDSEPGKPAARLLVYAYEVAGVTYEVAQDISALPAIAAAAPQLLGQVASVKYDTRRPTNSIIACEDWCGVPVAGARTTKLDPSGEALEKP